LEAIFSHTPVIRNGLLHEETSPPTLKQTDKYAYEEMANVRLFCDVMPVKWLYED
jgi:hypothetical protein